MKHKKRLLAIPLLGAMALGACSDDKKSDTSTSAGGALKAAGCPDTVVVQTDWFPESEHGATYQLMGPGSTASKDKGAVTGPLFFQRKDTGVKLEIRAGGPFLGTGTVVSQMYQDKNILLGYVSTDEAIKNSKDFPTVAVVAPQNISPQIILWDATKHPAAKTIADIAKEVNKVAVFGGATYIDYLVAKGIVPKAKVDTSYQGDKILVGEGDKAAHQGFATAEPFQYANLKPDAVKVAYQLIYDTGWDLYPESLAIRTDKLAANKSCLAALVPMVQQAQIDYLKNHAAADKVIIDTNTTYASFWQYGQADADNSVKEQIALGIVGNGKTPALGDLEEDRITAFIAKALPVFASEGVAVKDGLKASDIFDNQFIDSKITYTK
ncbi:MAG: ABC transporter substrate-binding protein [Actinomycetota bacterium]